MRFVCFSNTEETAVPAIFNQTFSPSVNVLFGESSNSLASSLIKHGFSLAGNAFHVRLGLDKMLPGACEIEQIHSDIVVEETSAGPGCSGDGLFAVREAPGPAPCLGVRTADCLAVAFAAEIDNVRYGAVVHAGWRGYTKGIHLRALNLLASAAELRGVSRARFLSALDVFLAPAIFGVSYECGSDVGEAIAAHHAASWAGHPAWHQFRPLVEACANVATSGLPPGCANAYRVEKVYPDLQLLMACDCVLAGISAGRVQVVRENTWGSTVFYSYRQANLGGRVEGRRLHTHLVFSGVA